MAKLLMLVFFFVMPFLAIAQKPEINYTGLDSQRHSLAYRLFSDKFDTVIAYTTEGYWQSDNSHYYILAVKGGFYYKGTVNSKRVSTGNWSKPYFKLKKVEPKKARGLIEYLNKSNLWGLSRDSLNNQKQRNPDGTFSELTLQDATNYRFELITPDNYSIIDAYSPEYFLEELPEYIQRAQFIKIRDRFLSAYKEL